MNEGCEGENSRMTPGFFAYATGRMALPLVEMGDSLYLLSMLQGKIGSSVSCMMSLLVC